MRRKYAFLIMLITAALALPAVFILLSGCGEVIGGPLASITIEPDPSTLAAGYPVTFTATGRDGDGNIVPLYGNFSISSVTPEVAEVKGSPWNDGNKRLIKINGRKEGTAEVTCSQGSVHGRASITVIIGTIESISVASLTTLPVENDSTATFIATGEVEGTKIYITPSWEVIGNIGTIESTSGNTAVFRATNVGFGTIEASFGGAVGSKEVWVKGLTYAVWTTYTDADNPNDNYSAETYMDIADCPSVPIKTREAYLLFDLSNIPKNTTIQSAEFRIKTYYATPAASTIIVECLRLTATWEEGTLKWNDNISFHGSSIMNVDITGTGWFSGNLTSAVQDWVNGTYDNFGFKIAIKDRETNPGHIRTFNRNNPPADRPRLFIRF